MDGDSGELNLRASWKLAGTDKFIKVYMFRPCLVPYWLNKDALNVKSFSAEVSKAI